MKSPKRSALVLLALSSLGGCASPLETERDDLEEAKLRWEQGGIADYSFQLGHICECLPDGPVLIVVEDGEIVSRQWVGTPPAHPVVPFALTIDELLELIDETLVERPHRVTASYAPDGYPIDVFFDMDETTADDEWGVSVREFTRL